MTFTPVDYNPYDFANRRHIGIYAFIAKRKGPEHAPGLLQSI